MRFVFLQQVDLSLQPFLKIDLVAQSVEHLTFNQGVMGSSPIEITTLKANNLIVRMLAFFCAPLALPSHNPNKRLFTSPGQWDDRLIGHQ